jgi:hypothetical protein
MDTCLLLTETIEHLEDLCSKFLNAISIQHPGIFLVTRGKQRILVLEKRRTNDKSVNAQVQRYFEAR